MVAKSPDEREARRRLTNALKNRSTSFGKLRGWAVDEIAQATGVCVGRLRQIEEKIMAEEAVRRR